MFNRNRLLPSLRNVLKLANNLQRNTSQIIPSRCNVRFIVSSKIFLCSTSQNTSTMAEFTLKETKEVRRCYVGENGQLSGYDGDIFFNDEKKLVDEDGALIELYNWEGEKIVLDAAETDVVESFDTETGSYEPETKTIRELIYVLKSMGLEDALEGRNHQELVTLYYQTSMLRDSQNTSNTSAAATKFKADDLTVKEIRDVLRSIGVVKGISKMKRSELVALLNELPGDKQCSANQLSLRELRYVLLSEKKYTKEELNKYTKEELIKLVQVIEKEDS